MPHNDEINHDASGKEQPDMTSERRSSIFAVAVIGLFAGCGPDRYPMGASIYPLVCPQAEILDARHAVIDVGEVNEGELIDAGFVLRNRSGATVALRDSVETSCSCMSASVETPMLEAGASTTVRVRLSSKGGRGTEQVVRAAVHVAEPDATAPFEVLLKYRVRSGWRCAPESIVLEPGNDGVARATVRVVSMGKRGVKVESVSTSLPGCAVTVDDAPGGDPDDAATITLACRLPPGLTRRQYVLQVNSTDADIRTREVVVVAGSPPALRIVPARLSVSDDAPGTGAVYACVAGVQLVGAVSDCAWIDVSLDSGNEAGDASALGRLTVKPKGRGQMPRSLSIVQLRYRLEGSDDVHALQIPVATNVP